MLVEHVGAAEPIAFSEVTAAQELVQPLLGMYAHAAAFGDVNGDGWQDLFVGTFADYPEADYQKRGASGASPDKLLLGGPGGFSADTSFPGTHGRTTSSVFADLDNDGDADLVIGRHTLAGSTRSAAPSVLLRNDGGKFAPGVPLPAVHRGRAATPLDYDGDGLLDLFVTDDWFFGGGASVLLRNKGGLVFENVTAAAGVSGIQGFAASPADLTGDGWPDLVVTGTTVHAEASTPAARLFVNKHDGSFREAPNADFTWTTYASEDDPTGVGVGDLNRDGRPDLVIGQHFQSTLQRGTRAPIHAYLNEGLDNAGNPRFRDITEIAGLPALATKSPEAQIADFDNDGWPDILTTASSADGTRPTVFRNQGLVDGVPRFSSPAGLGNPQYWVNSAVADVDRDGRLDVFATDFDPNRPSLLFHNDGATGGHWLDVI
ncbi:MAG: FG-GAP repeat domain-containing protein, partial [Acidimicrobiales bacterium]